MGKVWDEKLGCFTDNTKKDTVKVVNAYFPWNEELAKESKPDIPYFEPVKEPQSKVAAFEYSIEIACTQDELNTYQVGVFSLGKTKNEANISSWNKTQTEKGFTLLTASVNVDESKTLNREFFISSGSASSFDDVRPVKQGLGSHTESFIPVKPAVQVGECLGWPTEGYFYHFVDDVLTHEYKLMGEGKWAFQVTRTTEVNLTDELVSAHQYSFILLPWKINNAVVTRQHLLYLSQKMTTQELENITSAWLDENACLLDVNAIVKAKDEQKLTREPKNENQTTTEQQGSLPPQKIQKVGQVISFANVYIEQGKRELMNGVIAALKDNALPQRTPILNICKMKAERTLRIGVFFDGTGQNNPNDAYKEQWGNKSRTNVARLFDAYPEVEEDTYKIYVSGVGTVDDIPIAAGVRNAIIDAGDDETKIGQIFGVYDDTGAFRKWQSLLLRLRIIIANLIDTDVYQKVTHIEFDVFGFSRGAALARHFINAALDGMPDYLNKELGDNPVDIFPNLLGNESHGKFNKDNDDFYRIDKTRRVSIRFVGLFDTVGSFYWAGNDDEGNFTLSLKPDAAKTIFQICAKHEYRKNFPLTSLTDGSEGVTAFDNGTFFQEVFPGCHTDIGGGYPSKEQYGRKDLPEHLNHPVDSTYNREWIKSHDYGDKRVNYNYPGGSVDFNAMLALKLKNELRAWDEKCQNESSVYGDVKLVESTLHYYKLMPISNALSGLTFERMKQQGEAHGILWVQKVLDEQKQASFDSNNDALIDSIWNNIKEIPLGNIAQQWEVYEKQLLNSYVHRPHDTVINPGYDSIIEKGVNSITHDNYGNPQRKVFSNE
ncbi:DUF2235 domain-containing protein [Aliivibrio fischeri]|uniref:DUF2235 domain-containing protein n=1 Tax=Aliivibrio fischeri TaxID=668 RepID=UPI001F414C59|nr:DUF2235 domain-containing protein [Aliivibrio fischeri]MCE7565186.1 DUF2235 domain-containing protein [Aliivibrio fischeri]